VKPNAPFKARQPEAEPFEKAPPEFTDGERGQPQERE